MAAGVASVLSTRVRAQVYKTLVVTEAAGFVTLGEAPYTGTALDAFAVGRPIPNVAEEWAGSVGIDLLIELMLARGQCAMLSRSVCSSHTL